MLSLNRKDPFKARMTDMSEFVVSPAAFLGHRYVTHENVVNPACSGPLRHFRFDRVDVGALAPNAGTREATVLRQTNDGSAALAAYWLPQGGYLDVPKKPQGMHEQRFVFTPDFSGCSLIVDSLNSTTLRVYHLEGCMDQVKLDRQYRSNRDPAQNTFLTAMTFADYGDEQGVKAVAFMVFEDDRWNIHLQRQNNASVGYEGGRIISRPFLPELRDPGGTDNHAVIPVPKDGQAPREGVTINGTVLGSDSV